MNSKQQDKPQKGDENTSQKDYESSGDEPPGSDLQVGSEEEIGRAHV